MGAPAGRAARWRRRFQLWVFGRLYRYGCHVYDPLTRLVFGGEWDAWRRAVLPLVDSGPVLDLGCGTGALLTPLTSVATCVVGVDRELAMLRAAARARPPSAALVQADAMRLPFTDATFAAVVSTFPAPFILNPVTLGEVRRVLRPGGVFVVVIGGTIDRWETRRLPLRVLYAAFYGREREQGTSIEPALRYPGLPGAWRVVRTPRGRAWVWLARRAVA